MSYPDLIEIRLMLEPEIFVLAAHRGKKRDFNKAADILKDIQKMNLQMAQSTARRATSSCTRSFGNMIFHFIAAFIRPAKTKSQIEFFRSF